MLNRSLVKTGQGKALVVSVGKNTVAGKIQELAQQEDDQTPLQERLDDLVD